MKKYPICVLAAFAAMLMTDGPALAQDAGADQAGEPVSALKAADGLVSRYPKGSIQTGEQADQALLEAKQRRAELDKQFLVEEGACYSKFFVTACTDAVKERRRVAFAQINPIEVEANAFKRRARVEERDKTLAEQQAKDEARVIKRADTPKNQTGSQASPMPDKDDIKKMEEKAAAGNSNKNEPFLKTNKVREAQHQTEREKIQAKESAGAAERAENAKDYERKQEKAQERQRKVAERKAKREAERVRKINEAP
jgi:hypothetical protein